MAVEETKCPAIIGIDTDIKEVVVDSLIDDSDFMLLGKKSGTTRDTLFLFAFALGWKNRIATDLAKPYSGGFIRTSSFSSQFVSMINLVRFAADHFEDSNVLRDHKGSYQLAEQYANAGFHILKGEIQQNKDSEVFSNELIAEMDAMYQRLFSGVHYQSVPLD